MMWNSFFSKKSYQSVSFEDVLYAIQHRTEYVLVNTLPRDLQQCLIQGTLDIDREETVINEWMDQYLFSQPILVYGKHAADSTAESKSVQFCQLGFSNVYLYRGGMFEWLLLQDIYGVKEFPTTSRVLDLLLFRPPKTLGVLRLTT